MNSGTIKLFLLSLISIASLESKIAFSQTPDDDNTYSIIFLTPRENDRLTREEKQKIENNHLRNIGHLSEKGILANAGPFEGGGEMLLLKMDPGTDLDSLLKQDPAVKNALMTIEILVLELRKGNVCEPDFPYEMRTYSFIRYTPANQIASYKTNSDYEMKQAHQQHLDALISGGSVILEGTFTGNDGGILIYKGKLLDKEVFNDPAIKEGYLKAEKKTIWLNKGSFCES